MVVLGVVTLLTWLMVLGLGLSAFKQRGLLGVLRRLLAAALCAMLGILLGALVVLVHLFHAFAGQTLVATVTTERVSADEFELRYARADWPEELTTRVRLRGDQWSISGGIVKWRPWLTVLGLKSYHKPMRLSGQFSDVNKQRAHVPTIYPIEPGADRFWELLYRAAPHLPFIEAVYGSSAYVYVEPHVMQEIYVTPSGYLIRRNAK